MAFLAGQTLTADLLNTEFDRVREVYQQADQTVNNSTTFVSSTYLTLPVEANTGYIYEAFLVYDTGSTPDFKHKVLMPSGGFVRHGVWTPTTTVSATNTTIGVDALDTDNFASGGISAGTRMTLRPSGIIAIAATAGDVTIQFAQQVANASNTSLTFGSWMRLTRLG